MAEKMSVYEVLRLLIDSAFRVGGINDSAHSAMHRVVNEADPAADAPAEDEPRAAAAPPAAAPAGPAPDEVPADVPPAETAGEGPASGQAEAAEHGEPDTASTGTGNPF